MPTGGTLPMTVDTSFHAAGYETDYFAIHPLAAAQNVGCATRATTGAVGSCYGFKYDSTPAGMAINDAGLVAQGSAGVAWQANLQPMGGGAYYNNFGVAPGVIPPAGATVVSFYAKGAVGGENVTFGVGGLQASVCNDAVTASTPVVLTTTWTKYTIPLGGTYATGQVTGFSWYAVAATTDAGAPQPLTFYIDNIVWAAM
jgi:hypothetical protein